eukprot:539207-Amphidinium_carterae.1
MRARQLVQSSCHGSKPEWEQARSSATKSAREIRLDIAHEDERRKAAEVKKPNQGPRHQEGGCEARHQEGGCEAQKWRNKS